MLLTIYLLNIGKYLDVTQQPVKSDLIVCFGGGNIERIQKTAELYEQGYSDKRMILLTGRDRGYAKYLKQNIPEAKYRLDDESKKTAEEVRNMKRYMIEHNDKSAIIVSDPPHTRRIKILTELIPVKNDENLSYVFVSNDVSWWHPKEYYKNRTAVDWVWSETLKIAYTYFNYGIMENLGIGWDESKYYKMFRNGFIELKFGLLSLIDKLRKW